MSRVILLMNVDGVDTYLTVELENNGDYFLINIEQRHCGVDTTLSEQLLSIKDLLSLRNAIDYIITTQDGGRDLNGTHDNK